MGGEERGHHLESGSERQTEATTERGREERGGREEEEIEERERERKHITHKDIHTQNEKNKRENKQTQGQHNTTQHKQIEGTHNKKRDTHTNTHNMPWDRDGDWAIR